MPKALIHVVKNTYFGTETDFNLYEKSNILTEIEAQGGKTLVLPALADRVTRYFYTDRLSIATAAKSIPI